MKQKIRNIGHSQGIIIPKEILNKYNISCGEEVFLQAEENGIKITPYDDELATQLEIAKKIMQENKDVLRQLAKS
ncbi:MAG: AbrB/MazE/SpoVT family DNA-binding domain-containing protein [Rickettsia sp.]|nr:AbrB/MazE/SpoVT family DNA-binding domain-containing protein [Rickettsia sp.]